MTAFLYYTPKAEGRISKADAVALGLGYVFDDDTAPTPNHVDGPDDQRGQLFARHDHPRIRYEPKRQTWRQIPGSDAWVGMFHDDRPQSRELARRELINGYDVTACDGSVWHAPTAQQWSADGWQINPDMARLSLNDEGVWTVGGVQPRFESLWTMARNYFEARATAEHHAIESGQSRFTFDADPHGLAVSALQINYRLASAELDLLGIFTPALCDDVVDSVLDRPHFLDFLKKKATEADPEHSDIAGPSNGSAD